MVTNIVPVNQTGGVPDTQRSLPITDVEGLEGFDQGDVTLPRRSILQPTSQKGGEEGCFYDNLTGESLPLIEAVILRATKGRSLWTPGENRSDKPECQSYDGVRGRTTSENPEERLCGQCPYNPDVNPALWEDTFNPKRDRRCPEGRLFLCADYNDGSLFMLSANGMSVKSVKSIISMFAATKRPVYSALVKFWTQIVEDKRGTYYILKATKLRWLEGDELVQYRGEFQSMQGVKVADIDETPTNNPGADAVPQGQGGLPF